MRNDKQPLLYTKFYRPRRRAMCVVRPRLRMVLDYGLDHGWILVVAAAGMGKTTLIVDWTETHLAHTSWLSLDRADNDPTRFFAYLFAAIKQHAPQVIEEISSLLQVAFRESYDEVVDALLNALVQSGEQLIVVLDDYHHIENKQIHDAMTRLLSHCPPVITFVLITRADPPLPLARMRVSGDVTEVRADALAFTVEETTRFFNESFGLGLTNKQVEALSTRTEGWSAGLQMAALAMQSSAKSHANFIDNFTGSHRHVLDYLMEEVLRSQPDAVREFMMQTSPLQQFSVALCNAVLNDDDAKNAAVMLDYLETHNLFLIPLDDSRQWYRYHHLFADLLRSELEKQQPAKVTQVQRDAAAWYEAQGDIEQAINYASNAASFEQAAMLMQQYLATTSYWQVSLHTWRLWYRRLPTDFFRAHAHLGFLFGNSLLIGGFVDDALAILRQLDPAQLALDSQLMYEFVNVHERHNAQSYAALAESIDLQTLDPFGYVMFASIKSAMGDFLGACQVIETAYEMAQQANNPIGIVALGPHRCRLYAEVGRLQEARNLGEMLLKQLQAMPPGPTDMSGFVYMALGRALLGQNHLQEAEDILRKGLLNAEKSGFLMNVLASETMLLAQTRMAQGDEEGARAEAARAVALSRRHELRGESEWREAYRIQILLRQGDLAAATKWLQERPTLPHPRFCPPNIQRLVEAQIYVAQNHHGRAISLLTELTNEPQNRHTVDVWVLLALARQLAGDGQHAFIALTTAINMAEPNMNLRTFLDQADLHAKSLVRLLTRYNEEKPNSPFIQKLLSLLPANEEDAAEQSNILEPLSERELDVLNLIVAGHTNKEIAEELVLAINTVKWYIKVIYSKLHVKSRAQAIARAHELKLTR